MDKSIAEILSEPATVEEIIRKANEINEKLKEVDNMPRLVTLPAWYDEDDARDHGVCPDCSGTGCYVCHYSGEV